MDQFRPSVTVMSESRKPNRNAAVAPAFPEAFQQLLGLHKLVEDAATDGRPDPRPGVREEAPGLGDLVNDFNFDQSPRPPVLLPVFLALLIAVAVIIRW